MDDRQFLEGLKSPEDRSREWTDAAEYFVRVRRPGHPQEEAEKVAVDAKHVIETVQKYDPTGLVAATRDPWGRAIVAGTALAAGAATALASAPRKKHGGRSKAEADFDEILDAQSRAPAKGFLGKMKQRTTEFGAGVAKAFREHPVKATATGATYGALTGAAIAKLIGAAK